MWHSKEEVKETTVDGTVKRETVRESFQKPFEIPHEIIITDVKTITAEYKDGVLTVRIPAKKQVELTEKEPIDIPVTQD